VNLESLVSDYHDYMPELSSLCKDFYLYHNNQHYSDWYNKKMDEAREKGLSPSETTVLSHSAVYCMEFLNGSALKEMAAEKYPNGNKRYGDINALIDRSKLAKEYINKQVEKIEKQVGEKVPKCRNMKKVSIPQYGFSWGDDGEHGLRKLSYKTGNPLNGAQYGNTFITSTGNMPAIDKKVKEIMQDELGMKTSLLKDYRTSLSGGGIHCRTHFIRYCRPRGAGACQAQATEN